MNFKAVFLKFANKYNPNIRKPKYTHEYYFDKIIILLTDLHSWRSIKKIYNNTKNGHYTTVYKKYKKWCDLNIFEKTYYYMVDKKLNKNDYTNIIIDSSLIRNANGIELIASDYVDKKHNSTKLSILSTTNKYPIQIDCFKGNLHDVHTINPSIKKLKNRVIINKQINIIGDKGYIMGDVKKNKLNKNYKVKVITSYRKNQKKINTIKEKKLLKHRYKIEHIFAYIKEYSRLIIRQDKLIKTFIGFVFIGLSIRFFK